MLRAVLMGAAVVSALHAECVRVEGPYITAADLAKAYIGFQSLDPGLVFSFAPPLGAQRTLSPAELDKWAKSHGLEFASGSAACFVRASYKLGQDDVVNALRAAIGPHFESVRIEVVEACQCAVPAGRLDFEMSGAAAPPADRPETPVLWRGRLIGPDKRAYQVWVRVRVLAAVSLVRAAADLKKEKVLSDEDLEVLTTQDSPLRFPNSRSRAAFKGKILNLSLRRGTILQPNMVHSPSDVERGSVVRVEVVDGGARLMLTARAETAGNRGDLVTLTNPAGAARFRASVTGPGRAEISLLPDPLRSETSNRVPDIRGGGAGSTF